MKKEIPVRNMVVTAVLSAIAAVLMFLDFSVPLMPGFIKMDISEFPALLASFAFGPWYGVAVCLLKNLVHLTRSSTAGVGELCNFALGVFFVVPAGIVYKLKKTRKNAIIGSIIGAVAMALLSLPLNYFVTYPIYQQFMPLEQIIGAYQKINPNVDGLLMCLLVFNVPFTLIKGLADVVINVLIYKRLSSLLHG